MLLLAFDPGETTGWVLASIKPSSTGEYIQVRIEGLGEFRGLAEFHELVKLKFREIFAAPVMAPTPPTPPTPHHHTNGLWDIFNNVEVCVIEDYVIYPNRAASHSGSKVLTAREIGHIEYVAFTHGLTPVFQSASMAKQRWPDKRLKQYVPGMLRLPGSPRSKWAISKHKQDAIRHLFTYIERKFKKPLEVV